MSGNGSATASLMLFSIVLMTILSLLLVLGGLYILYCLSRAAAGLDRLAGAAEEWVALQHRAQAVPQPVIPGPVAPSVPAPQPAANFDIQPPQNL